MARKLLILAVVCGLIVAAGVSRVYGDSKEKYENLQIFAKVLNLIQEYYVEDPDVKRLIYGGIKGMLAELDPHTSFLPPEIFQEFETETAGEFGGLGIEITVESGVLTVLSPIEDTPAWKAGIKGGDKIISIDGSSTKGFSLVEAAKKMRGKRGQMIRLTIFREGFEKPRDFEIVRDVVKVKSIKFTDLNDGYLYVRVTQFIEKTAKDLEEALQSQTRKYGKISGLIIDLRNNPGGLLDQAVKVSDFFLEEGVIVSTIGRKQKDKEIVEAKKEGTYPKFPLVVLMNEFSASASEIVAGALQDHKRAVVIGQRSFGKGSVQSVVKLGDGAGLKLTVARYYTPNGISIQAEGIKPDIALENIDQDALQKAVIQKKSVKRESELEGHLKGEKEKEAEKNGRSGKKEYWFLDAADKDEKLSPRDELLKKDFQILQAFNYLRSWDLFTREGAPKATK